MNIAEDLKTNIGIRGIDNIYISINEKGDRLLEIRQYWCNAEESPEMESFNDPIFKLSENRKSVRLFLNSSIHDAYFTFTPNGNLTEWLKLLSQKHELHIFRTVIAPKMTYFHNIAIGEHEFDNVKYFIIKEQSKKVPIKSKRLGKTIKLLNKMSLPILEEQSRPVKELGKYER